MHDCQRTIKLDGSSSCSFKQTNGLTNFSLNLSKTFCNDTWRRAHTTGRVCIHKLVHIFRSYCMERFWGSCVLPEVKSIKIRWCKEERWCSGCEILQHTVKQQWVDSFLVAFARCFIVLISSFKFCGNKRKYIRSFSQAFYLNLYFLL